MELDDNADEIYKKYLSNFEEKQHIGKRVLSDDGMEI